MATHFKLHKEGQTGWFWAMTCEDSSYTIIDVCETKAYSTKITKEILDLTSERLNNPDVHKWAKLAFSSQTDASYVFSVENERDLLWKKVGRITLKLGKFPLEDVPYQEALNQVLEASHIKMNDQSLKISRLEKNVNDGNEQRKGYEIQMAKMNEYKKGQEQYYYSHFLPILHSKQDKIRELEQKLEQQLKKSDGGTVHSISSSDEEDNNGDQDETDAKRPKLLDDSQNFLNLSTPL